MQEELDSLEPGEVREREPAKAPKTRNYAPQNYGPGPSSPNLPLLARVAQSLKSQQRQGSGAEVEWDEYAGTWERLTLDSDGLPLLERGDVWDPQDDLSSRVSIQKQ